MLQLGFLVGLTHSSIGSLVAHKRGLKAAHIYTTFKCQWPPELVHNKALTVQTIISINPI